MLLDKYKNNELVPMTRRFPTRLSTKALKKDSVIAEKLMRAWDIEHNPEKLLSIFLKEQTNLSDERFWETMRTVWILTGKLENVDIFRKLMRSNRKARTWFSTPEEIKKLKSLPESLTIYRATNSENDGGISWTLSFEYAQWYKSDFDKAMILERTIAKEQIFALIERNKESEVIVL